MPLLQFIVLMVRRMHDSVDRWQNDAKASRVPLSFMPDVVDDQRRCVLASIIWHRELFHASSLPHCQRRWEEW